MKQAKYSFLKHCEADLVPALDADGVPHPEDDLLEAAEDGGAAAEVVAELHEPVHDGDGQEVAAGVGPLLVFTIHCTLYQCDVSVQDYIVATPSNQKPGQLHPYSLQTCSAAHTAARARPAGDV